MSPMHSQFPPDSHPGHPGHMTTIQGTLWMAGHLIAIQGTLWMAGHLIAIQGTLWMAGHLIAIQGTYLITFQGTLHLISVHHTFTLKFTALRHRHTTAHIHVHACYMETCTTHHTASISLILTSQGFNTRSLRMFNTSTCHNMYMYMYMCSYMHHYANLSIGGPHNSLCLRLLARL